MGVGEATFYNGKKKSGALAFTAIRGRKQQLIKLAANLNPDKQILQDMLKKKF
nr:hypothetical protein [Chryseobacterium gregarium]